MEQSRNLLLEILKTYIMKIRTSIWTLAVIVLCTVSACHQGTDYPGYTLISRKFVKEANAECYYFEHDKSGAKVFKIAADDPNKTFSIAFETITDSDCGTPHIMEHCVLGGSRNFPVKSTFDEMSKGSLNTFMNAMTSKDRTVYPVASMNTRDYFNLMHVYLDAVFNPLVLERPSTFYQEGWHYELLEPDGPVVYKGVVYNEMKGAFSNPDREMYYQTMKHLFPDNCYRYSSGGRPEAIPDLTYDQFINYYRKHYHPSNSYIFLYGDADLERELAFIDSSYLSAYERAELELQIPLHEPFSGLKEVVRPYPVPEGADTQDQAMLRLSFVVGDGTDIELEMAMTILEDVLVNQESAPLRLALQEAGIGKDVTAYVDVRRQQTFNMTVRNANTEDMEQFRETVYNTFRKAVEEGLDKEAVEGTINRMEFRLREGNDAQKGIMYMNWIMGSWMFAGDPYTGMEYEKPLAGVKAALTSDYLEQIIEEKIINNPHALLLVLEPVPGLEARNSALAEEKLAQYKSGLSGEEVEALIESTRDLIAQQDTEDSPEALATIPKLNLGDVNPEPDWFEAEEREADGNKVLFFKDFTNNVIYTNFIFDMRTVGQEMIPYLSILRELLGKMDTENYSYEELEKSLNIHTGGFNPLMITYLDSEQDDRLIPKFSVNMKGVSDKSDKLLELAGEILLLSDYSDTARIRNLLDKHLARVEADVKGDGMNYAFLRQRSYHSPLGVFLEAYRGISYYWFLKDLMADYENRAEAIVQKLQYISGSLFTGDNMITGLICGEKDYQALEPGLVNMAGSFPGPGPEKVDWELVPEVKNEGLMAASKVQYVVQGANYRALGYRYNGHLMVLDRVMESGWLNPQIRVKGGAYGGYASFLQSGDVFFGSYRDPNLAETLGNFAGTADFIGDFEADSAEMTRFIIGTISLLDIPLTPTQKGNRAIRNYFSSYTIAEQQRIRDEVLSTSLEDIRALEPLLNDLLGQHIYCVYGNQEKIRANKDLFHSVVSITEH
jgi:Zn-dependent M16 (insulinase) family peptidase